MMTDVRQGDKEAFSTVLKAKAAEVNTILERVLADSEMNADMRSVLEYTLAAPGKRIRPVLLLWCCEVLAGEVTESARIAATAIEMVHTYSLVHDDLPAMDDDDLRRGRPTCHKKYDEATAVLAGDALLTLAFEVLATRVSDAKLAVQLIQELSQAAGPEGMIAGQVADLKAENKGGGLDDLKYIHNRKTAYMFRAACVLGGLCGGASSDQLACLREYGLKIGLGFQIADDILDVQGTSQQLGKTAGKDEEAGKLTYPSLLGMDAAKTLAKEVAQDAIQVIQSFGSDADLLRELVIALLNRTS